jgi:D-beta-D-heptose 7-phosphate kinase/D-beta-D-heptose 1-phosphate adenosyltransferase
MRETLLKTITNLGSPEVLVVGDFMLDVYTYGDALRISPEAPVPVLKVCRTDYGCGGAASVAVDLAALGAKVFCVGIIGKDSSAAELTGMLDKAGVDTTGLIRIADRPTTTKQRLIGLAQHRHRQQLIRMDIESTDPLSDAQYEKILQIYRQQLKTARLVCLQDYNKGMLKPSVCQQMIAEAAAQDKKVLIDPCLSSDYSKYTGATLITPNRREAATAAGFEIETPEAAKKAAEFLTEKLKLDAAVITLDKEGAYLSTKDISEMVPTRPRTVYDVTGAGDIVLATLAVTLAGGCDYRTAVQLANIAGGLEVEKFGAAPVAIEEIINEIISENLGKTGKVQPLETLLTELNWHRAQKNTIVFTNGCFDIVHRGHIEYLKFCKAHGDVVVIGLNSDGSVRAIKGPQRPINNQLDRAAVLAALESVDYVVIFDEPTPIELIKSIRPDVLVKGRDWAEKGVIGQQYVESYGGKVILAPLVEGKSSTSVIDKVKSLHEKN